MLPTREEWALAIAERFFTHRKQGETVLLDVDESVLRRISEDKGWNLADPVADLADSLAQDMPGMLFWGNQPLALDANAGLYEGLPTGLADFALGMVIANIHFASQQEWSRAFNPQVGIAETKSIFNSQQTGTNRNLRILLHSIHEWCEDADIGDIPPLPPPFYPWNHTGIGCRPGYCTCAWGGWGYIGKFYDHLETTKEDKRTFLHWIHGTMSRYDWLDYEDLINEKDYLRRNLVNYSSEFSPRLQSWLNHGVLKEKFWALVDNYLRHLIALRDNPRQRTVGTPGPQGDDLEEEEIRSIVERKDSIRPIIWVDRQMNGSSIEYHLSYHIEDMGHGTKVELDGDELDLPLDGEDAARAVGMRKITVDGTEVVQKLTGLHPLCVLVDEDSTFKSRHMLEDPEHAGVPGGSSFHLLCFGSGPYLNVLDIIQRLTDGQHLPHDIVVQGSHSLPGTPTQDHDDPLFGRFHAESVFLFRDLDRNWKKRSSQDPPQLRLPKTGSTLRGIRHRPNSETFHTFGGHPELVVTPDSGQQTDGDPALVDLGAGQFRVSQDMLSTAGAQTPISKEFEWRAIRWDEMSLNDPVPRDEFGSVTEAGSMIQPQRADLQVYSDLARTASADMPKLAEDHVHRIFLNDDKTLSETIDAESRFPPNSTMRPEYEVKVGEALNRASIDEINDTLNRRSDYVEDKRADIVALANEHLSAGRTPRRGLIGLHELGQGGARVNINAYDRHLRNMAGQSIFYNPLVDQLEPFDQPLPKEVADAIRAHPLRDCTEFSERVYKLRVMQLVGGYSLKDIDGEIQDLIGMDPIRRPWFIEESTNRDEALELIDKLASVNVREQSEDVISFMRAWTDYYNDMRGCIERCDYKGLRELSHKDFDHAITPGTAWVRLSMELVDDSSLTDWTNPEEVLKMRMQCRRMYDRLNLRGSARKVIESRFRAIGRSLDFAQQRQENLESSMEGEEE